MAENSCKTCENFSRGARYWSWMLTDVRMFTAPEADTQRCLIHQPLSVRTPRCQVVGTKANCTAMHWCIRISISDFTGIPVSSHRYRRSHRDKHAARGHRNGLSRERILQQWRIRTLFVCANNPVSRMYRHTLATPGTPLSWTRRYAMCLPYSRSFPQECYVAAARPAPGRRRG